VILESVSGRRAGVEEGARPDRDPVVRRPFSSITVMRSVWTGLITAIGLITALRALRGGRLDRRKGHERDRRQGANVIRRMFPHRDSEQSTATL